MGIPKSPAVEIWGLSRSRDSSTAPRTERGEAEAAALIEAKRLEIVVRRHEPDTFTLADLLAQCIEECAPDAVLSLKRRNEREFALTVRASIGQEADRPAVALGRKSRQCKYVDQFPAPGLQRAAKLVQQRLCPWSVRLSERPDRHEATA